MMSLLLARGDEFARKERGPFAAAEQFGSEHTGLHVRGQQNVLVQVARESANRRGSLDRR